ncbi:NAD(P)/FAD-dependent oxidoreductase [Synergistes jonesii]|uniref:NAD(P)/FAD-dependent oxidoreductase n=1 Tax=Synergistes jonesii TaxID=2754 RepID=UPI00248E80F0|nr:FAD-binding oxidoreductase [Synergistes jonesii]
MIDIPKTADIVIIGGGGVGAATAYYLAKSGRKNVVVLEKNTVCSGSTGRCGAGIRAQWGLELNCRMALACLDTFEHLDEELGLPTGLNQGGYLLVAYKEKEWAQFQKNVELQHSLGIMSEAFTDVKRAQEICPGVAVDDAIGFTFYQRDGHADPFLTTFAFQEAAKRYGAAFCKFTEVIGLEATKGGMLVETNRGNIDCKDVINCAGSWAQDVAALAGVKLPNWAERHQIIITEPVDPGVCPPMLMSFSGNYYIQQRPHGSIIAGESPSSDIRLGYTSNVNSIASIARTVLKLLPRAKNIRVVRQWAGHYDMTPDSAPILGETDVKHFWHATGFSGHGFMLAPVAGQIMTALLNGDKPPFDPTIMDYKRFERGEKIVEPNVV